MAKSTAVQFQDAGRRIPEDVAVVGFDDIPAARLLSPSLTTINQFQTQLGSRAMELLLERLTGLAPPTGRAVDMPFELIIRAST